jgi:hypothetical protein
MIDFIGIGTQRSGSTFLANLLRNHRKIDLLKFEANYFSNKIYKESFEGYLSQWNSEEFVLRGEKSPSYMVMRQYEISRMSKLCPNVKLLFFLRNPVDRMWSGLQREYTYSYLLGNQIDVDRKFTQKYITKPYHLDFGLYNKALGKYNKYFNEDKIFIGFFEDFKNKNQNTIKKLSDFLQIEISSFKQDENLGKHESKVKVPKDKDFLYFLHKFYLKELKKIYVLNEEIVGEWIQKSEDFLNENKKLNRKYLILYWLHYMPKKSIRIFKEPFRFLYTTWRYYKVHN